MKLFISFSAREEGNCGTIARYLAGAGDEIVHFAGLHAHGCMDCAYECFGGVCPHRTDGVYDLYRRMLLSDCTCLLVPLYGGNPSSLYFAFCERGQDFFCSEEIWQETIRKLYIIGVCGARAESPDFLPCLNKWFDGTKYAGRVLGLERHLYGQKMGDLLLDAAEVREKLDQFLQ